MYVCICLCLGAKCVGYNSLWFLSPPCYGQPTSHCLTCEEFSIYMCVGCWLLVVVVVIVVVVVVVAAAGGGGGSGGRGGV